MLKHWTFQPRVLMCFGRLLWELLLVLALPNGNAVFDTFERVGDGFCLDSLNRTYDAFTMLPFQHYHCCLDACMELSFSNAKSPGFHITPDGNCTIFMNDGDWPRSNSSGFHAVHTSSTGSGRIFEAEPGLSHTVADGCWRKREYELDSPTNGSRDDPETGGAHPGLADFIEEDFAYCLSAGAIPGPAIINTASTMESCWSYCSEQEHCQACFRNCEIGNCSEREAGCTYYAVQLCDSGRRNDCGVRSLRRKTVFDGRSGSDMIAHLVGLLALFCVIQGMVLFCYWRGWIRAPLGPKAVCFIDEQGEPLEADVRAALPVYWSNAGEETEFNSMLYVGQEQWAPFAELLDSTYRARSSQDRPCPDGACPKRPGGCPCVQPDGEPGLPASYVIRRVLRAENSGSWTRFVAKRAQLRSRRQGMEKVEDPVCTAGVVDQHPELFAPVDASLNEVYLWHGTHVRAALNIAHEGFDIQTAGLNGTMYGKGLYFAENSTKADEYARDEPHGFYQDVFAVLLCRVCLGKFHFSEDRFDSTGGMAEAGTIDSTVGDRTRTANTFREFTAYYPDQVYPEYVIFYSRRPKAAAMEAFRFGLAPLHAQLPVYFQKFHLNPQVESFEVQYGVRRPERDVLEQMAQACYPGGRRIEVLSARRIEISSLWNRYVLYKKRLRGELEASGLSAFASAEFLEGQARGAEILTDAFMKRPSEGGGMRPTWRGESLEGELQEHFLWHGTTRKAAEAIVRADFRVPKEIKNGARYGCGLYFAEDVSKSLAYAPVNTSSDGRTTSQFLLLCRVLCGQMYYTSERYELDAVISAHKVGKNSVLANPLREGPREFIVWHEMQVYPEYLLEVTVRNEDP
eukprot:s2375_g14.t2